MCAVSGTSLMVNAKVILKDPGKSDLHMHTVFCDGRHTPEEMVLSAIEKGMECIGFSGHSYVAFDSEVGMDPEAEAAYRQEIVRMKEVYQDRIRIFCGLELDYETERIERKNYDYLIGSVHYVPTPEGFAAVDDTPEILEQAAEKYFQGDFYLLCETYFALVANVVHKTGCDIIGHFDLISKFNEKKHFFDEEHPRYVAAWKQAADHLLSTGKLFEINTGAISRGWRTAPYPSQAMIQYIRERGGRFLLSGDSHDRNHIGFGFDRYIDSSVTV